MLSDQELDSENKRASTVKARCHEEERCSGRELHCDGLLFSVLDASVFVFVR